MKKSKTIRTLVAAGCVASSGCVGGPRPRPPPPPAECPPGADATHSRFGLPHWDAHGVSLLPLRQLDEVGSMPVPVRDGQAVRGEILGAWKKLPDGTSFDGHLYLGHERVYGRFTAAHLPSGETVPVCLELMIIGEPERGRPVEPGSTATQALIFPSVSVQPVERFK